MSGMKNLRPLALLTLAFTAACGVEPSDEDYDDIASSMAAVVSDEAGSELEAAADAIMVAQGMVPAGLSASGSGELVGQRGTLDYSYTVTCENEAGRELLVCDSRAAQARLQIDWTGDVATARRTASLVRSGDWTLSGLQGDVVTLDGAGRFDVESEFQALNRSAMRTFVLDYDARYAGVRVRKADHLPIDGRIEYTVHAERTRSNRFRDVERTIDVSAVVTFSGDGQARLVLDGTRIYDIDLVNRTLTPVPSA